MSHDDSNADADKTDKMTRVFRYGALAPTVNAALVYEQMRAAHRYRNLLVEIERARRAATREPEADNARVNALAAALRRGARALTPCYWGTYLLIEASDDQARRSPNDPGFVRWEGNGAIGVQLQGGLATEDELDEDRRVQVTKDAAHTCNSKVCPHRVLRMRVGSSAARAPIWAEVPFHMHREFPTGAMLKYVTVHMRRDGRHSRWSIEFTCVFPSPERTAVRGSAAVGVDLGWRMKKDGGMRVCGYKSSDGEEEGELALTAWDLGGFDRVESLHATRDGHLNVLRAVLRQYRERATPAFVEATTHMHLWRSPAQFIRLLHRLGPDDVEAAELLRAWRYRDNHLWDWERGQQRRILEQRKKKYEAFAAGLAQKYPTLVLEKFDLRAVSKKPESDAPRDENGRRESHQETRARAQRHEAATSELRSILVNAFERRGGTVKFVSAVNTTRTCSTCGLVCDRDFASAIAWTCDCGAEHDQDINAATNLCERLRADEKVEIARADKSAKTKVGREAKWTRLKREKVEKAAARKADGIQ